jgi:hypothetical protein
MATSRRRPFEQQDPTKGNFQAYKNLATSDQANRPAFNGRITLPGLPEERGFSLWGAVSRKTGKLILSGPVTPDRDTQWANLHRKPGDPSPDVTKFVVMQEGQDPFPVKPHHMILFTSPNTEITEGKKAPPKMFGYYNPGGEHPVMVISAFEHADRNNNIMLLGPVEAYDPDKSYEQQLAEQPEEPREEDEPEIPEHLMAQKKSGRGRPADEGPHR